MARVLVCGTLAYDDIGAFDAPLEPGTRNVKLETLRRGFGGCAMNIAYNLAGLGHLPVPFVYAGDDYSGDYARHVASAGISESGIFRIGGTPSARGIVLTGHGGAQFTAFYPGPSGLDRWPGDLDDLLAGSRSGGDAFEAAVLAPDLPAKTSGCAARITGPKLRIWCPGQYAELLEADDIDGPLDWCNLLVVNRHEWLALTRHVDAAEIQGRVARLVITDGPGAVEIFPEGATVDVPEVADAVDPTGCGDAFVAAITAALLDGHGLVHAVEAGVALAGRCLASPGAQSHAVGAADDIRATGRNIQ
jgi:adenosine kinase